MRWFSILLLSVSFFPTTSLAQSNSEQELKSALEQLREAQLHRDADALNRIYADDFVALDSNGTIADKAARIKQVSQSPVQIKTLDFSDLNIRVFGTTAVVTGVSNGTAENRPARSWRFMQVWMKQGSRWQEMALAITVIKSSTSENTGKQD